VISTGNDFSTRQYYTVDQQALLHAKRPQIISGRNNNLATETDLLDRVVSLNLLPLSQEERKDEKALWEEFNRIKGQLLGALCTVIATGLKNYGSTNPPYLVRMADFAKFMIACEPALPCGAGDFMRAYENNIMRSKNKYLVTNHVASAVISLMKDKQEWIDTAEGTLTALSIYVSDPAILANSSFWPSAGNKLRAFLEKSRNTLTEEGIGIQYDIQIKHKRYMKFTNIMFLGPIQEVDDTVTDAKDNSSVELLHSESISQYPIVAAEPEDHNDTAEYEQAESPAIECIHDTFMFEKINMLQKKIETAINPEELVEYLEKIHKLSIDDVEKINVYDDSIIVQTTEGTIMLKKKDLLNEEESLFEE
jgi:hypothetical protein